MGSIAHFVDSSFGKTLILLLAVAGASSFLYTVGKATIRVVHDILFTGIANAIRTFRKRRESEAKRCSTSSSYFLAVILPHLVNIFLSVLYNVVTVIGLSLEGVDGDDKSLFIPSHTNIDRIFHLPSPGALFFEIATFAFTVNALISMIIIISICFRVRLNFLIDSDSISRSSR